MYLSVSFYKLLLLENLLANRYTCLMKMLPADYDYKKKKKFISNPLRDHGNQKSYLV